MKTKRPTLHALAASLALTLSAAVPAVAGTPAMTQTPPIDDSGWTFRMAPYFWAQSLDGTVGVKGFETDVDVGFDKLIKHFDIGFMGAFELRHGPWRFTADMTYAKMSADGQTPHGILFNSAEVTMRQFLGNYLVSYSVLDTPEQHLDLYAGARVNYLQTELDFSGALLRDAEFKQSKTWVDPLVGLRYRAQLGGSWFVHAGGDVGGFGASSEFTWQALALLGYNFNKCCSAGLGYRALGTDYEKDGFKYDVVAYGPILGFEFRF